eukprot:PITA_35014
MCWIGLLKHKDEAFEKFKVFKALVENELDLKFKCLRSDRGGEFISDEFFEFCEKHGIKRQFSVARTPQKIGVVERMNLTIQQMALAMLDESGTPDTFWGEAAHTAVNILNKAHVRVNSDQTPYELWYGKPSTVKHFRVFGSKCFIKKTNEKLEIRNRRHQQRKMIIMKKVNANEEGECSPVSNRNDIEEETSEASEEDTFDKENSPSRYVQKNHPESQILGEKGFGVQIRRTLVGSSSYLALLSSIEPQNVNEASRDECWIKAMDEELEQIEKNDTWELVPRPHDKNVIGTKWIFKNKLNENGEVIRNKARLVCKGYAQQEGIYYRL